VTAPLRVAILGSGPRGILNAELLANSGIGAAVGFWDRTPARAVAAAVRFAARSSEDVTSLIALTQPDLVAVLTHPAARASLVAAAVAGGAKAIVIEKPLALTTSSLADVEAASGSAFVVVNTQYRWMPHWQRYLGLVRAGEVGDIHLISGSTGANILEQGPHVLGLCLAVAEAAGLPNPSWVLAGGSGDDGVVPADLVASIGLGDARISLLAGDVAPRVPGESVIHYQQRIEVVGSRGRLTVTLNQGAELVIDGRVERSSTEWPRDDTLAQAAFYRDVQAAIADAPLRESFPTRLSRAAAETRILFAAIQSARGGGVIDLA